MIPEESSYKNAIKYIIERRDNPINGIPTTFQKFKQILPAWDKNTTTIFAAGTGAGKTSWAWKHAVVDVIIYLFKNRHIKGKIYFFSLELKYTEVYVKLFSDLMYRKFGKFYSRDLLLSTKEARLTDEEINFLQYDCKEYLDFFDSIVTIIDSVTTPDKMYLTLVEDIAERDDDYKLVIVDTVNAMSADSGESKIDSIKKWNQEYALKVFRNAENCTLLHLTQLDKSSSQRQFSGKGENIFEKYIPTLEALGNDKEATNSANLVLAMLDPLVFRMTELDGYFPLHFKGGFRMIYVLKNNFGLINVATPFYYDGKRNHWEEITEDPSEFTKNKELYFKYVKEEKPYNSSDIVLLS